MSKIFQPLRQLEALCRPWFLHLVCFGARYGMRVATVLEGTIVSNYWQAESVQLNQDQHVQLVNWFKHLAAKLKESASMLPVQKSRGRSPQSKVQP